jgi:hypothetical protein
MPSSAGSSSILLGEGAGLNNQNTTIPNTLFNLAADKQEQHKQEAKQSMLPSVEQNKPQENEKHMTKETAK